MTWTHFKCSKCGKNVEGYGCKDWTTWLVTEYWKNYEPEICSECYNEIKKTERILHPYNIDSPLTEFYIWKGFDQFVNDWIIGKERYGIKFDLFKIKKLFFKQIERGMLKIRRVGSPNCLVWWSDDLSLFDEIDLPIKHSERA